MSLKADATHNEKWLQEHLVADPGLLGLGDVEVKDVERRQPHAGRLDLLLSDPEAATRYEVEIQLGATDERHIIRTIEYWDIEKARYPQYEHVAVLVAEDITSRFLNVISLFNKAIPLIAIELRALEVGDALTLHATTVLDLARLGTDEEDEPGQATDRSYWIARSSEASVKLADGMLALVNEITPGMSLKYNKNYIGLARDGVADNFVQFRPRREAMITEFRIPRSDDVTALIEDSSLDSLVYSKRWGRYRVRLTKNDLGQEQELLRDLVQRASGTTAPVEE
ncbi:hypothetical protein AYO39_00395 [Actinobacteria bacterium SCGC AG-212-D09]|nr:hypothetical protein AYO39_00395 [Actinobacteria bacterium SCGC AG-212-D09]